MGFFVDDADEQYVMVQNVNHSHGDIPTNNVTEAVVRVIFDFSAATDRCFDDSQVLLLDQRTGTVERVALASDEPGEGVLELNIPAGDARIFKYVTGHPFAGYPSAW